jgi:hypothetical protein
VLLFLTPETLCAVGTALLGVLLFSFASRLPRVIPHWLMRLVGFGAVCMALFPLWVYTETWQVPVLVGSSCMLAILIVHFVQTRREE